MNIDIVRKNIMDVIFQPCLANPWNSKSTEVRLDGLSEDKKYIMVKIRPDDSSWQCNLKDKYDIEIDFVQNIVDKLPAWCRDHLVTIKHDRWVSYSYVPVFDSDTQALWDEDLDRYISDKAAYCAEHGCE